MIQIKNFIQVFIYCEQFIKYECCYFVFFWRGLFYGWWVLCDGQKMMYWGGVFFDSNMCVCGMNDLCVMGEVCNCDVNDLMWREDSGLLIDKFILFVMQFWFGDIGDLREEKGFYILGKLKCYGIVLIKL